MNLFKKIKKNVEFVDPIFDKNQIINEILKKRSEECPGWKFFKILSSKTMQLKQSEYGGFIEIPKSEIDEFSIFDEINGDFLAIYTDVINKEIRLKGNPFSEYKNTVESIYQIVREIYITDEYNGELSYNIYKRINASSAKELFIKLKKEQE